MDKWEKAIEMLMNGIDRELAIKILQKLCPNMFGMENDKTEVHDYACTRCDKCWSSKVYNMY